MVKFDIKFLLSHILLAEKLVNVELFLKIIKVFVFNTYSILHMSPYLVIFGYMFSITFM